MRRYSVLGLLLICAAGSATHVARAATGVMYEAVTDYSGGNLPGMVPSCSSMLTNLTAYNPGLYEAYYSTITNSWQNGDVYDSDFYDPDVTGGPGWDNGEFDYTGNVNAFAMYCGHGAKQPTLPVYPCNHASDCPTAPAGVYGPGTCVAYPGVGNTTGSSDPGICRYWSYPESVVQGYEAEFGNYVQYGPEHGGVAFGESSAWGGWYGAATNGGNNVVITQQSWGMFPNHYYSEMAGIFAGLQLFGTTMPIGGDTNGGASDVGWAFGQEYLDNPWASVSYGWTEGTMASVSDVYNGYGCNIMMAIDETNATASAKISENWVAAAYDENDAAGQGYYYYEFWCNYNTSEYPISL